MDNYKAKSDFIYVVRYLAFIFDINYKRTMEILLENDFLNKKINLIRNEKNKKNIDLIEKILKDFIKERFDIIC